MVKPGITQALPRQMIIRSSVLAGKTPWSFVPGLPRKNRAQGFCKKDNFIGCPRIWNGVRLQGSPMKKETPRRTDPTKELKSFRGAKLGLHRLVPETMRAQ